MRHRLRVGLIVLFGLVFGLMSTPSGLWGQDAAQPKPATPGDFWDNLSAPKPLPGDGGIEGRIVGGEDAQPGAWPWQVAVYPAGFLCGGSLIDPSWVLTAAHCVDPNGGNPFQPSQVRVVLGEHNRSVNEGVEVERNVSQVIVHPNWNASTYDNDMALLRLSSPVPINQRIQTIPLAVSPQIDPLVADNMPTWVTGWGATSEGGSTAAILQQVSVPIISNDRCNASGVYSGGITANMLCAGLLGTGGQDACQGDSGGPLVVQDGNNNWILAGVTSWGTGCARPTKPGVYARVSRYATWIQGHIGDPPTPTPTPSVSPTVTPTPTATPLLGDNVVQNPGFENGPDGTWTESSTNFGGTGSLIYLGADSPVAAYEGDWLAWLGGTDDEVSRLDQTIDIPANAQLRFYYAMGSADQCGWDFFRIFVGSDEIYTFDLCQENATSVWEAVTLDLSAFGGQRQTLRFEVTLDSSLNSNLFLDNVSVRGTLPPTSTPTSTPSPTPTSTPTATPSPTPTASPVPFSLRVKGGPASMDLSWNVPGGLGSATLAGYRVMDTTPGTSTQIGFTPETFFPVVDGVTLEMVDGEAYCFQVEAVDDLGNVLDTSQEACDTFGALSLTLPNRRGASGQPVTIPVNAQSLDGLQMSDAQIAIRIDPEALTPDGVAPSPLTMGYTWTLTIGPALGNSQTITATGQPAQEGAPPTLFGSGELVRFFFNVVGAEADESGVDFAVPNTQITHQITPSQEITLPLALSNGLFTVSPEDGAYRLGDLNGDGEITEADGDLALERSLGYGGSVDPLELAAGDINGNGRLDAGDASQIYFRAENGVWPDDPAGRAQANLPVTMTLTLTEPTRLADGRHAIHLVGADLAGVSAGSLTLRFDPAVFVPEIEATLSAQLAEAGFSLLAVTEPQGRLRLEWAGPAPISGGERLIELILTQQDLAPKGVTAVELSAATLYDPLGQDLVRNAEHRQIQRLSTTLTIINNLLFLPNVTKE